MIRENINLKKKKTEEKIDLFDNNIQNIKNKKNIETKENILTNKIIG